ncbi:PilZ domain-containing protein [Croceicoccus ponticola]|uniref:PilZ domain-containing protein n=1 Tax=Croceicoccus ponticola TaxID=2217664 RepID=A0A437GXW7_9SPHN|nr:PilZ domain-containing protein [Croceicoccus ponticola]RVQ67522.1 PilZ domain-containing protein [Croceicoccus ponticola]
MIEAQIRGISSTAQRRWNVRRATDMETTARMAGCNHKVGISNLSEKGLMLETTTALQPGDTFEIELPQLGACYAEVVWSEGDRKGCRFFAPISKSVVSAAILRSQYSGSNELLEPLRYRLPPPDHSGTCRSQTLPLGLMILTMAVFFILLVLVA